MADLDQIFIPVDAEEKETDKTSSREDEPPKAQQRVRNDAERDEVVADFKSYRELREKFAEKAYKVAKYGLFWWATVLLLSAVGKIVGKELFSEKVLIAVTTASTVNLLAAFLGVIRGLFPAGKSEKSEEKK